MEQKKDGYEIKDGALVNSFGEKARAFTSVNDQEYLLASTPEEAKMLWQRALVPDHFNGNAVFGTCYKRPGIEDGGMLLTGEVAQIEFPSGMVHLRPISPKR